VQKGIRKRITEVTTGSKHWADAVWLMELESKDPQGSSKIDVNVEMEVVGH